MPNIVTREIQYNSEVLDRVVPVKFKLQSEAFALIGDRSQWGDPSGNPCPVSEGLSMRYLQATFPDPALADNFFTVQVPVASPLAADIQAEAVALVALGAVCIDFIGERWTIVPGIGTPGVTYALDPELEYASINYSYNIQSYTTTAQILRTSVEDRNGSLFNAQISCMLVGAAPSVCTPFTKGFKPRAGIIKARNTTTNGLIVRRVIMTANAPTDIRACLTGLGNEAQCVGYEGEKMRNLHLSLP